MKTTKQKLGKVTIPAMMPEISIFLFFAFSLVFGFVSFPIPMRIHFRDKNKNQVRNNNKRTIPKVELFIISSYILTLERHYNCITTSYMSFKNTLESNIFGNSSCTSEKIDKDYN